MSDNIPMDVERDRIYASDDDPIEALAELRRAEAVATSEDTATPEEEVEDKVVEEGEEVSDPTQEEEKSQEVVEDAQTTEAEPPTVYKFRANGQDFEFTQEEINQQFGTVFGKAMDYTQKMQKISPYRKMISVLEEEKITQEQLNLAVDLLKGDKAAIQKLIADKSIDIYDLGNKDEDTPYTPKDYGKDEHQLRLEDIHRQLSVDPEYSQTVDIIGRQWDAKSREALSDNLDWIIGLHSDVKSGVFAKVAPEAAKLKMLDGGSKPDIAYYLMAGQQVLDRENANSTRVNDPAEKATQQYRDDSAAANKRRAASSTRSRAGDKRVVDYLDDNDEKFDSWYESIMKNS